MIKLVQEKYCPKCKKTKPVDAFQRDSSRKDGLNWCCKECKHKEWKKHYKKHQEKKMAYHKKYYREHLERERTRKRQYAREHRDQIYAYKMKRRLKALQKISGQNIPKCFSCGCNDFRFLEINHINGDGWKEKKQFGSSEVIIKRLLNGTRKTDDLNVLCKVCNSLDVLKRKYEKVPMQVIWKGEVMPCQG